LGIHHQHPLPNFRKSEYGVSDQAKHNQPGEAAKNVFFLSGEVKRHACMMTGKWRRFKIPEHPISKSGF